MDFDPDDIAVVTGGTKGIGRAVVERFLKENVSTVATYFSDSEAAGLLKKDRPDSDSSLVVKQFDVGDTRSVADAFDEISASLGGPTILVNNAGIMQNNVIFRMDSSQWADVIRTNLNGTFYCSRQAARYMLKRGGGRIVNISSIGAKQGFPGQSNYAAAKAGILGLTRVLSRELGPRSIRVNAVCPGYTDTELLPDEMGRRAGEFIPLDRVAQPAEIAEVVAFLSSRNASYVNGAVIPVDGGMLGSPTFPSDI